jgi:Sigma-70 region 2/Histidine kinase
MEHDDWLADRFEENRAHLPTVAYRMLGSLSEAEDAVQESWIRLSRSDTSVVVNIGGWMTTIVARVCLNMLRSRRSRREEPLDGNGQQRARQRIERDLHDGTQQRLVSLGLELRAADAIVPPGPTSCAPNWHAPPTDWRRRWRTSKRSRVAFTPRSSAGAASRRRSRRWAARQCRSSSTFGLTGGCRPSVRRDVNVAALSTGPRGGGHLARVRFQPVSRPLHSISQTRRAFDLTCPRSRAWSRVCRALASMLRRANAAPTSSSPGPKSVADRGGSLVD